MPMESPTSARAAYRGQWGEGCLQRVRVRARASIHCGLDQCPRGEAIAEGTHNPTVCLSRATNCETNNRQTTDKQPPDNQPYDHPLTSANPSPRRRWSLLSLQGRGSSGEGNSLKNGGNAMKDWETAAIGQMMMMMRSSDGSSVSNSSRQLLPRTMS